MDRRPYGAALQRIFIPGGYEDQMRETLRQIGKSIRNASVYPPIRNHAAALASLAPPKDFLGQLQNIYNDFVRRWRYVKDPTSSELVTASPQAIWRLTMAGDGVGVGYGKGAGDCDCATVALGSLLEAIGFRTRLGTTAGVKAPPGRLFSHVFIQAHVPKIGWITLDPVLHPKRGFGETAYHSRIAWWDLDGNPIGHKGNYLGDTTEDDMAMPANTNIEWWEDLGMGSVTEDSWEEPTEWSQYGLNDWGWIRDQNGTPISAVGTYGYIDGAELSGMMAEVDSNDTWDATSGTYRTPMLELSVDDYAYLKQNGVPYNGMLALGDTGEAYVYDGLSGWFKKVFKKIKKGVKKVAGKIKKGVKKLLKKTKIGRWLIKVGGKIKKIAMKIVRPLVKFVGKYAAKLAPIAAIIPGYGTAIAGALMAAGKIANLMTKYGVFTAGKKGKVRTLGFKNPKVSKKFFKSVHLAAKDMKKYRKKNPKKFKELATKLARKTSKKAGIPKPSYSVLKPMLEEYKRRHPDNFAKLLRDVR
jgi:uncharacterized membrane protein YfbV (UPF0208 family)